MFMRARQPYERAWHGVGLGKSHSLDCGSGKGVKSQGPVAQIEKPPHRSASRSAAPNGAPAFGVRWQRGRSEAQGPRRHRFRRVCGIRIRVTPAKAASALRSAAALQRLAPDFPMAETMHWPRRPFGQHALEGLLPKASTQEGAASVSADHSPMSGSLPWGRRVWRVGETILALLLEDLGDRPSNVRRQ